MSDYTQCLPVAEVVRPRYVLADPHDLVADVELDVVGGELTDVLAG